MIELRVPAFERYIGIDYSGAETPTSSLKGLRVYVADRKSVPVEQLPPPSPRKYWTWKRSPVLRERLMPAIMMDAGVSRTCACFRSGRPG